MTATPQANTKPGITMKLPADVIIAREKITHYLLVRQSRNDKSEFLKRGGYTSANSGALMADLMALARQNEAHPVGNNKFGRYYEVAGILTGPNGIRLRVRTVWMAEHLSKGTKFITLIPIELMAQ